MLQLHNLSKTFDTTRILEQISIEFDCGIIGILGANGAGKTTFVKVLAGLLEPDRGCECNNNGETIDLSSERWMQTIGYLPQSPGLYERMTVSEYLEYVLLLSGWKNAKSRRERVDHIGQTFALSAYAQMPIGNLSGGTKQRVGIAQAVIHDPSVIIFDEPTNNLDTEERKRFHAYLRRECRLKTVFYIGHIINEMAEVCDSFVVIGDRKVTFHGSGAELIERVKEHACEIAVPLSEYSECRVEQMPVLNVVRSNGHYLIRYDSRMWCEPQGKPFVPDLADAYALFKNSRMGE